MSALATCEKCGEAIEVGEWPFCPHGFPNGSVIDDQLEGGPRVFEHLGHEGVYIESKSQWRREMEVRGLVCKDTHDTHYYRRKRKEHDERLRDTGSPYAPEQRKVEREKWNADPAYVKQLLGE